MFIFLVVLSTFLNESSETLSKKLLIGRKIGVYDAAFLGVFWGIVFLAATLLFGAPFTFSLASLPTLLPRIVLELLLAYISLHALIKAERSTVAFLRLLTIPLLLVVDIVLGYNIATVQIVGIVLLFLALSFVFYRNPKGKEGAGLAILSAILLAATASLYKYNITHFNSVTAEQIIVLGANLVFFYYMAPASPLRLLVKRDTGLQALGKGLGLAVASFAFALAPAASIVIALKRVSALAWAVLFGHKYFKEGSLRRKAIAGVGMVISILLLSLPYIPL